MLGVGDSGGGGGVNIRVGYKTIMTFHVHCVTEDTDQSLKKKKTKTKK